MKLKQRRWVFIFLFTFLCCPKAFSETIYFKDGRVVKEKITQRSSYYIVTDDGKMPHKYMLGQIERIEEDAIEDAIDTGGMDLTQFETIGMPQEKAKLIVALMEFSGVRRNMEENLSRVFEPLSEEQKEYYRSLFNVQEILERMVPVYDKYYNQQEVRDLIEFYQSPAGKKSLEVTPKIMEEAAGVSVKYIQEKMNL
jgi:hypothetical protein